MSLLAALTLKVSAILLLALISAVCLRTRSASARHWVLAVGVASAAVAPALHVLPILPVVEVAQADAGVLGPAVASAAVVAAASDDDVGRLAVTIWLVGAVASVGVLLVGLARLRWLRASSSRVTDGPWHRLCTDLAQTCGLKRGVDLLFGPLPGFVATWGWRRPVVMLPASAAEWSADRMRVVLLHELAHARRGDWMLQMVAEALRCVWWFNPLAWTVLVRLRRESEHAADDLVLARGVPATTCATHLIELAREVRKHRRTWLPAPAMARPSHLERRLSTMLNPHTNRRPMTRLARFGSLGVLVLVAILVASLEVARAVEQEPQTEPPRAVEQEPQTEPPGAVVRGESVTINGENVNELVVTAVQEQLATVLSELVPQTEPPGAVVRSVTITGENVNELVATAVQEQLATVLSEQEPQTEPPGAVVRSVTITDENGNELVATAVQEQLATALSELVLSELQTLLNSNEPVRIGGDVPPPRKIHNVPPVYPPAALPARVQGLVILEATIDPSGEVGDIEVLQSVPELDEAAIAAVEQWRYEPTLVDGVAVPVLITLTISFWLPSP